MPILRKFPFGGQRLPILLALTAFFCILGATSAQAGIYYEAVTTVEKGPGSSTVRAWLEGDKAHIEFTDSDVPQVEKGNYLLTNDGGKTFFMVNPSEKTYMHWDMSQVMSMLEGMSALVSFDIENTSVEKLEEKAGKTILGHDTRYVRFESSFDMKVKIMGMKRTSSTKSTQEVWVTDAFDIDALSAWVKGFRSSGSKEMDELLEQSMSAVDGFPLESITVSVTTDKKGRETVSRSVTKVKEVREEKVDSARFEMPAGYQEIQMIPESEDGEGGNPLKGLFGRKNKG